MGPASRMWGIALDHVVGLTVVTADGKTQHASSTENPDLFWALKGAGASFGVITEFELKTHAAFDNVVLYSYTISPRPFSRSAQQFKIWLELARDPNLDRRFATQVIFSDAGMFFQGTFYGPKEEFEAMNVSRVFKGMSSDEVVVLEGWLGAVTNWVEQVALWMAGKVRNSFYNKSLIFTANDKITASGIYSFLNYLDSTDSGTPYWTAIFDLEGGATNDIPQNETAFAHRDAVLFFQPYLTTGIFPLTQKHRDFLTGMTEILREDVPAVKENGVYPGYIDPYLGPDAPQLYWGSNYPRLQTLKSQFDPGNIFRNPQSVELLASY